MSTNGPSSHATTGFLDLPVELRIKVYSYCFYVQDGYHYNHQSMKLTMKDGTPINLSVFYVCRLTWNEAWNLPLRGNQITFTTGSREDECRLAARLDAVAQEMSLFSAIILPRLAQCITGEIYHEVIDRFPQFVPVIDYLRRGQGQPENPLLRKYYQHLSRCFWGDISSAKRQATSLLISLMLRKNTRRTVARVNLIRQLGEFNYPLMKLIVQNLWIERAYSPWEIPADHTLDDWETIMMAGDRMSRPLQDYEGFRFSAAANAIRFLSSMDQRQRLQIRTMILEEDYQSAANPVEHGMGLIWFCQENSELRIERRVALYANILAPRFPCSWNQAIHCPRDLISRAVAEWVGEALALESAGMPPFSFRLVITSTQCQLAAMLFVNVCHRDALRQMYQKHHYDRGGFPDTSPLDLQNHSTFTLRGFPEQMQALTDLHIKSVSCSFNQHMLPFRVVDLLPFVESVLFLTWIRSACFWSANDDTFISSAVIETARPNATWDWFSVSLQRDIWTFLSRDPLVISSPILTLALAP